MSLLSGSDGLCPLSCVSFVRTDVEAGMFAGMFYVADSTFGRHGTCSFSFWALSLLQQRGHRARVGNFLGGTPGAGNAS